MTQASKIIFTKVDEAPALATHSLLPILQAYTKGSGMTLETWDISLAGRIIANFPDHLTAEQKIPDYLTQLGELCEKPEANILKLPNISASIPQLQEAIKELQERSMISPTSRGAQNAQEKPSRRYVVLVVPSARSCGKAIQIEEPRFGQAVGKRSPTA
jgi:isocitrate dehydrogenase